MGNTITFKFVKCVLLILSFTQVSYAQLASFTLNVASTNETCAGNGTVSFSTTGTTTGATVLYSIYQFPNLSTPIATLSGNTFGGLTSGNFRVIATQSLGVLTNSQQQDIGIGNQISTLTYQIDGNNLSCGIDGTITINILTGNAVAYEIFSGPIIFPIQASNVFSGLVLGNYQIRVFDNCGDGIVQSFSVFIPASGGLSITSNNTFRTSNCSTVLVTQILTNTGSFPVLYPLNVQYTVFQPITGTPIVSNQILTSGNYILQYLPLFPNQYYTYNVKVIDACGNIFNNNGNVVNSSTDPRLLINSLSCTQGSYTFAYAQGVTITGAPSSFVGTLPFNVVESTPEGTFPLVNIPLGYYSFTIVDVCGNVVVLSYNLSPYAVQLYEVFTKVGCDGGFGSVRIKSNILHIQTASIISAPFSYTAVLPQNVSFNIDVVGFNFYMNNLPEGQYIFKLTDECGLEEEVYCYITGFHETPNSSITENCGSFNINLFHSSNALNVEYFLQKYDAVTNQWVHPITGAVGSIGNINLGNAIALVGNSINYNYTASGVYRIIFHKFSYGSHEMFEHCYETIYSFEYNSEPIINAVYSFECSNNTYDVLVVANGIGNLVYRITTKNGNPFLINNGNNPIFLSLEPASYNFQVQDTCGNIFNILYDVPTPFILNITPNNLCEGATGSLSTILFPFLEYQWWKGTETTTILSTTNSLTFPNFNILTDGGIYHVRIRYSSNPNSCIDIVLEYTVASSEINPNAGIGTNLSYCGSQGTIDLFTLLTGNFNTTGVWQEVTSSGGMVSANLWDAATVSFGIYQFKYSVNGFCGNFDEAFVEITINPIPQSPIATVDSIVCNAQDLHLFAENIDGVTYQWNGPNGFSSPEQNPIIANASPLNNGTYTVSIASNGCQSLPSSVEVAVAELPQFTIEFACINNSATLTAIAVSNSFDTQTATYQWSNSEGFSTFNNPINITGQTRGIYTLTVTNSIGCSTSIEIDVLNTLCTIPKGISPNGDDANDEFDLSGFSGVQKVKIVNRYGMVVFEQENYINQWKGQDKNGNALPVGTYYYVVNFATTEAKTGWIYLTRD